jgi:hypothetical protein
MSLNTSAAQRILTDILAFYRFPERTFVGSPGSVDALKQALNRGGRKSSGGLEGRKEGAKPKAESIPDPVVPPEEQ